LPFNKEFNNVVYNFAKMFAILADRFVIGKQIGSGGFGTVYEGFDKVTHHRVAVKCELVTSPHKFLATEYCTYNKIYEKHKCIPMVYWYGVDNPEMPKNKVMVMEQLGLSIDTLFVHYKHKFTLKTVLMIGFQLIDRIAHLHSCGVVHRDIKLDNLMTGILANRKVIYLIDYGLTIDIPTVEQPLRATPNSIIGTPRFCSTNAHLYSKLSRRDDLESFIYIIIFLLVGSLPWDTADCSNPETKFINIYNAKVTATAESVCIGLDQEIKQIYSYIRQLKFDDIPDYMEIKQLLLKCYNSHRFGHVTWDFEWINI
jgi:serine/threonine protein kinase